MADPVGEESWVAFVDEASRSAGDLLQRVEVVELYKSALNEEPYSLQLWLAYCEWTWSLHTDCQSGDAGWPEDEQLAGQEIFTLGIALNAWEEGAQATRYRLNDSHVLWNRWLSIELEELSKSRNPQQVERIRSLFVQRLQVPHTTWDDTSQMFSTFLTKYDEAHWEEIMVQMTQLAKPAKEAYSQREVYEVQLRRATESGSKDVQQATIKEYLEWESSQARRKNGNWPLCFALYERVLLILGTHVSLWEDYAITITTYIIISGRKPHQDVLDEHPDLLHVLRRATKHCPWSGSLWSRYMLKAEMEGLQFSEIEQIKHAATRDGQLDRDGMNDVIAVYSTWCGYLRRRAFGQNATDEDIDVADVGMTSAFESVQQWGRQLSGDAYKGDPSFHLERAYIQYLTQKGSVAQARAEWVKLVKTHGDSYEFWQRYYVWEMTVGHNDPRRTLATAVLKKAISQRNLDWPEKIMENYILHCESFEDTLSLAAAIDSVHKSAKFVVERRQQEAAAAAAAYAQQQLEAQPEAKVEIVADSSPGTSKRKRDSASETDGNANKKIKNETDQEDQNMKRDRENTTVLVTNLPAEVTQTKVRQYFKEYGHINNLIVKAESDGQSSAALIEFRSTEDVKSALLRDGKYFTTKQIHVESGTGLTIYVTNYPPTADEEFMHKLFKDCGDIFSIRWPSLKFNTHRRFCYISFRTASAASAATQLNGKMLDGRYQLTATYSDPPKKKSREDAVTEGREVHFSNLDRSATDDEVREIFSKYGTVENVKLLRTMAGQSKGAGFISFEKKESALRSLELDKTKFKSQILMVEMAVAKNFKPISTTGNIRESGSPGPSLHDGSTAADSPAAELGNVQKGPSRNEIAERSITLMNVPDTVNDARIRSLVQPFGEITKLSLRPDHQGAIIEFADVAAAGRASLALEGHEIAPGRKLHTGDLDELIKQKGEYKTDRIKVGAAAMAPPANVRRPAPSRGVGPKRGLGFTGAIKKAKDEEAGATNSAVDDVGDSKKPQKSNADFKAMFLKGGS